MNSAGFRYEQDGHLAWIIIDAPDEENSLTEEMWAEFDDRLATLGRDDDVRVIAIRGVGADFSVGNRIYQTRAGYELGLDYSDVGAAVDQARLAAWLEICLRIWNLPKPVLAAVHGRCLQHAATMCVFCDLTVVAENAEIGMRPGIPLGAGFHAPIWSWLVGWRRAKELEFLPAKRISGVEAVDWGWANYSVPENDLVQEVTQVAQTLCKYPLEVLRLEKLSINRVAEAQGFIAAVLRCPDMPALLHLSPSVQRMRKFMGEVGYDEAARRFADGSFQL
jgi:enoyl-CoA hydratase/carnithine racemase